MKQVPSNDRCERATGSTPEVEAGQAAIESSPHEAAGTLIQFSIRVQYVGPITQQTFDEAIECGHGRSVSGDVSASWARMFVLLDLMSARDCF